MQENEFPYDTHEEYSAELNRLEWEIKDVVFHVGELERTKREKRAFIRENRESMRKLKEERARRYHPTMFEWGVW